MIPPSWKLRFINVVHNPYAIFFTILLFLAILWFEQDRIINYIITHFDQLVGFILGGLLSSLIATFIYSKIFEKNVIREIQDLPKAFSKDIIEQLFDYSPATSSGLAIILSDLSSEWYDRNYERVLVEYAEDTYKLQRLTKVEKADKDLKEDTDVWDLDFQSTWEWYNDSEVIKRPLRDLNIILTTTDAAISYSENFLTAPLVEMKYRQRREFFDLTKSNNIFRSQIEHRNFEIPLNENAVNSMFNIKEIMIKTKDDKMEKIDKEEVNKINGKEFPVGVYKAYKIVGSNADRPLNPGEHLTVSIKGNILLPVQNSPKKYGILSFRPSDIIKDKYELTFIYPDERSLAGLGNGIKIKDYDSARAYEPIKPKVETEDITLPKGFEKGPGEKVLRISMTGPLTDLNFITLMWEEK